MDVSIRITAVHVIGTWAVAAEASAVEGVRVPVLALARGEAEPDVAKRTDTFFQN